MVYLHYEQISGAEKAKGELEGRLFDGKTVGCNFYDEKKFEAKDFE